MQVYKSTSNHLKKETPQFKSYRSPKRGIGSQSETPSYKKVGSGFEIRGYQKFTITENTISNIHMYDKKFKLLSKFLGEKSSECETMTDLGCSNGLLPFIAAFNNYKKIVALDHDKQCVELIKEISSQLNLTTIEPQVWSFGDPTEPTDIVFALALIHWVYSSTAFYGEFKPIIEYLKSMTKKFLVIEWINTSDHSFKKLGHLSMNPNCIKEPYTKENFLKALHGEFPQVFKLGDSYKTRELYVCSLA